MINKPLHQQIKEDLLSKIEYEDYKVGDKIPNEVDLATHYKVSRPTVRQAINALVIDGFLERRKKRGTIVRQRKINQEFTHVIESYNDEMTRKGLIPKTTVLSLKSEVANEEVTQQLELKPGESVYKLVRLRYAEEDPIVLVTTYIPLSLVPNLKEIDFTTTRFYEVLEKNQTPIKEITRKLELITADETVSDLLSVEIDAPLFYFHSVGYIDDHVPIEYSVSKYRGDLNSFIFNISS
ncbi:GntR family transcriptional regulator [Mammaliicoccus sciuri]|uniref:GntR family transcriptional regulator n=1 Tax=Mammaliicoccus sciuri TaxID=1296 RepID=UPI0021CEE9CC|nr:GntR family transcriptional regulator [Mammaliicoccus sciuri]UXU83670.1 GntR family transcriptional regulator [Mammaliicoccus sciuri]UXU93517.1 GntR family transcriptional regulator [Mammaliicoccus sciuri]UXV15465.1 GntR family transcriptional regulator [Mammaliicoccus sciuri]UXV23729.1 GntR family transcriptional regulator [Mammaliicoccus sciuri]UXV26509.1 GntR family transcriptional regulator [Mammaliicoccus sciuri]